MAKRVCVSLRQIKEHELHTTLRYVRKHGEKWSDIYLRFGEIQNELTTKLIKTGSSLLLYYLILSSLSDGYFVSVTAQGYTASIPSSYVTLIASITLYFFILQFQSVIMILRIRSRESAKIRLHGFSANAYGLLMGQDDMALVTPIHSNGFMKERFCISEFLTLLTMVTIVAFLLPLAGFFVFISNQQIEFFQAPNKPFDHLIASIIGSSITIFSMVFLLFFNVPLPLRRHSYAIRWGFLTRLYPFGEHPRIEAFVTDDKVNKRGP